MLLKWMGESNFENLFFLSYVCRSCVLKKHKLLPKKKKKRFLSQNILTEIKSWTQKRHKRKRELLARDWLQKSPRSWTQHFKETPSLKPQSLQQARWGDGSQEIRCLPKIPELVSDRTALAPQVHSLVKTLRGFLTVASWLYFHNTITYTPSFDCHNHQWAKQAGIYYSYSKYFLELGP